MKLNVQKQLIYIFNLVKTHKHVIISYTIACFFIYIGLWTTAWEDIPEQVDESVWLKRSVRLEATFSNSYPDVFEMNFEAVDQLSTSAYIIGLGRWLQGIPAEAVKRYKHGNENIAPDIRASMLAFYAGLSSLSLLILFFWLHHIYGSIAAISTIALMMSSSFWQIILRRIMAEPCLFLFYVLAFGSTMWLVELLFNQKSLRVILTVATFAGFWIGLAAGVKLNGLLLFVGVMAVLLTLPWRGYEHYFYG